MLHARTREAEVVLVPPYRIASVWRRAERLLRKIPHYDLEAARQRVLSGEDKLWFAALTTGVEFYPLCAVILTSVRDNPPLKLITSKTEKKVWPQGRTLVVHMAQGRYCGLWIASAVERITAYGMEHGCRILLLLARHGWRQYAVRFWSPAWEVVGYSRDRPKLTFGRPAHHYKRMNQPGWYRVVQPVEKMTLKHYESGTMCYFQRRPHDSL